MFSSPTSSLYRSAADKNIDPIIPKKSHKTSPKLHFLKSKLRNSLRRDSKKTTRTKSKYKDCYESDVLGSLENYASKSSSSSSNSITTSKRQKLLESICNQIKNMPEDKINGAQIKNLIEKIRQQQTMRNQVQTALEVCRSTDEFHNSRELVEAEQLMLMSCLKECSALEELISLWQNKNESFEKQQKLGFGALNIKYLEFELKTDSIFDTHFNYYYLCVCTYRDQVEFTMAKERTTNRIIFNNLQMHFINLTADFQIRVEIFALRLRKLARRDQVSSNFVNICCCYYQYSFKKKHFVAIGLFRFLFSNRCSIKSQRHNVNHHAFDYKAKHF